MAPAYVVADNWAARSGHMLIIGTVLMIVGVIIRTCGDVLIYWVNLDWDVSLRGVSIVWIIATWLNVMGMLLILWAIFHRR